MKKVLKAVLALMLSISLAFSANMNAFAFEIVDEHTCTDGDECEICNSENTVAPCYEIPAHPYKMYRILRYFRIGQ